MADPNQQPEYQIDVNGDVYLGPCDFERRWQGGIQYDSLKIGLSLPMRVPKKLYDAALEADDPLKALEELYRKVIQLHQRLVREEVNRQAIPILETMGRIAPNVTEMIGGLEAIDGDSINRLPGTVGISQLELRKLQGEIQVVIDRKQAAAKASNQPGGDAETNQDQAA